MKSAVILGTGVTAIAAMREATLAGLEVIHVTEKLSDIARHSRYRRRSILLPLAGGSQTLEDLLRLPLGESPALLWPTNDNQVKFVAQHHRQLSERFFIPIPAWNKLERLVDKYQLYQLAYKLGIPAPQVSSGISAFELNRLSLSYPCIVKPKESPDFFEAYGKKVHIAGNPEDLKSYCADALNQGLDVMVSEIIPGPDDGLENFITYRTRSGEFTGEMMTRRIRQDPHDFGMATVAVTEMLDPEIQGHSRKLLAASEFFGFAVIEWKRDERDHKPKLIEVNPRPILSQRLLSRAGINYANIIIDDSNAAPTTDRPYREGVYWIDSARDRYQFNRCRKLPGFSYRQFFRPYWKRPVTVLPLLQDPGPRLARTWLRLLGKLAVGRGARRRASEEIGNGRGVTPPGT